VPASPLDWVRARVRSTLRISTPNPINQVPASPLDWVMKYARITLVQLKVERGDLGEI